MTVLLLVDFQKAFDDPSWGERNNPDAEKEAARLLAHWRKRGLPVFHIQHTSHRRDSLFFKGSIGHQFKEEVKPAAGESIIQKSVNSAFIGTPLEALLNNLKSKELVIAGLTTPHCVSTTVRMAANLGFSVWLPGDACAAFEMKGPDGTHFPPGHIHQTELAILQGEFAEVCTTEKVLKKIPA
ncbi:cysteine hydrolase family protein [Bacillus infantis]|uniref:cysteine hydrolase family protein n=1 Tax=Bacillus infantis TaxID=324767 RepID=UPI003CF2A76D